MGIPDRVDAPGPGVQGDADMLAISPLMTVPWKPVRETVERTRSGNGGGIVGQRTQWSPSGRAAEPSALLAVALACEAISAGVACRASSWPAMDIEWHEALEKSRSEDVILGPRLRRPVDEASGALFFSILFAWITKEDHHG